MRILLTKATWCLGFANDREDRTTRLTAWASTRSASYGRNNFGQTTFWVCCFKALAHWSLTLRGVRSLIVYRLEAFFCVVLHAVDDAAHGVGLHKIGIVRT